MERFLANETLTVAVMTVLFAGDFYRNLLTVPGWVVLAVACATWAIGVLVTGRVSWRVLPLTLVIAFGWIAVSPLWSPYVGSSFALTLGFFLTVAIGMALATSSPLEQTIRRMSSALRIVLGASVVFEIAVGLSGSPLYPVGMDAPAGTSIELAWSRAEFFEPAARIQGIVGNANLLGMLGLLALLMAVARLSERPRRPLIVFDVALAAFIVFRTGSSTVLLALVAVAGVWALAWLARRPGNAARATFTLIIAGGIGAVVYALTHWPAFASLLGKSADMTHRFDIWNAVSERIAVRPITGFGFVGWWPTWEGWFGIHAIRNIRVTQAHNLWLDLTMQVGLIGLVLFAATFALVAWRWWRLATLPTAHRTELIALGFVTAMLVQSITESRALSEWGIALFVVLAIYARERQRV